MLKIFKKTMSIIRLIKSLLSKRLVIIYQMGKVGSSSIEKTLNDKGFYVIHLHTLKLKKSKLFYYERSRIDVVKRIITTLIIKFLIEFRNDIKIISIIRNPVDRNISAIFQNLDCHLYEFNTRTGQFSIDEALYFMLEDPRFIESSLNWFDEELKKYFGIDIFECIEKGFDYKIIKNRKCSALILNFTKLNESGKYIGLFLGTDINLCNANQSSQKWYRHLYHDVKETYVPSEKSMQLYQSSKLYNLMK